MEKIIIDDLTQDSVSIKKQNYTTVKDIEYPIGDPWRKAYVNSVRGRQELETELENKYITAIFAIWGDTPIVEDKPTDKE